MIVSSIALYVSFTCLVHSFFHKTPIRFKFKAGTYSSRIDSASPKLLKDPNPNSIGNFFENKTEETSFIQCYMLSMAEINGNQYGVGFPVDSMYHSLTKYLFYRRIICVYIFCSACCSDLL